MKSVQRAGFALCLAAGLAVSTAGRAQESLDGYLEGVRETYGLPALAAAVTRGGEIVAAGAVGTRVAGMEIPVTLDDRFHLGSDTKAMTATVAGALVDEGRIEWTSTVGDVLGGTIADMNPALAAVTLEQLLSHSSGIPTDTPEMIDIYMNPVAFEKNTTDLRVDAIDRWKHNAPKVPEGSPFQYANFGYLTAGAMLEAAAGEPWERLVAERIYGPLGLETAGFGPQASFGMYDAPVGHAIDDAGTVTPMTWGAAADVPPVMGPAGNAHMSVLDFARWTDWNAGGGTRGPKIVTPETLAEIHRPHVKTPPIRNPAPGTPSEGEYALGWGVIAFDWATDKLLAHNGSNGMNLAKALVDTTADLSVVVMTNFSGPRAESAASEVQRHLYEAYRR
ncbi:methylmalonyl-CoA mutase [Acuticoccus sediminis]|uniref:Methylmalonyl-CoA mutase n=1 Tax=Acuticoccus sediminis TaxID=2184697 RepID=A0A8B2NTH6_9HYPH|nr:serine hydrolase domain-containing protein [Acuticoccus sediminis]RAI01809.1 methylmalonyl-CoA mutase [Acuticoccus sediminis]